MMNSNADVKILLVDDYRANLDALEVMLESSGCTLVRAESAEEGLLALLRHEFAAMIVDIKMPTMNGIELARLVKQRKRTEHIPILFLTAHAVDEHDVLLGYGAGAVDYLSKPINAEILRSKVAVFVDLFRKTRELARLNEVLETQIAERLKAQTALEAANDELERRVQERTMALREAKEEAERQSRMKDEFVATVSHELRTPMNVILGWLHLMTSGKSPRPTATSLAVLQRNARLQAQLIDDLLDINRLSSGHVQLDMTTVDIAAVAHASVQALQPVADAKGVQLVVGVDPAVSAIVGDPGRLQQILWNLLNNAIKFNSPGGRIDVLVRPNGSGVQISVHDTGRGIAAESLPHVFEKFWQADSSSTRANGGLGLGLAITKHLVELHGGEIEVSSPGEGLGSTFTVRLPGDGVRRALDGAGATSRMQSAGGYALDTQAHLHSGLASSGHGT
jgi:signal transduction histidine kinase